MKIDTMHRKGPAKESCPSPTRAGDIRPRAPSECFSSACPPRRRGMARFKQRAAGTVIAAFVVASCGVAVYIVAHHSMGGTSHPSGSANTVAALSLEELIAAVGKHMILPEEMPVVAVVEDVDTLKRKQPFFEHARNGDHLLIFPENKRAILYSPARDIVVNSGSILSDGEGDPTLSERASVVQESMSAPSRHATTSAEDGGAHEVVVTAPDPL